MNAATLAAALREADPHVEKYDDEHYSDFAENLLDALHAAPSTSEPSGPCPGPDCPYCAGEMCARFDDLNCTHDSVERHGYGPAPSTEPALDAPTCNFDCDFCRTESEP